MLRSFRLSLTLALSALTLLSAASASSAATTVGSTLAAAPNAEVCTSIMGTPSACTLRQTALPAGAVTAPIGGVVVRWRVRLGMGGAFLTALALRPRVVRGNLGVAKGDSQTIAIPLAAGTREFSERIPIQAGDSIALDVNTNSMPAMFMPAGAPLINSTAGAGTYDYWAPQLVEGVSTPPVGGPFTNQEALYNADIEPDADGDGFGDETQDLCPTSASLQTACSATMIASPKFRRGLGFTLTLSEAGPLDLLVERLTKGRLRKGKCSTRARRGKRCTIVKTVKRLTNLAAAAGPAIIPFSTDRLKPGAYRATITAHNPSGVSSTATIKFRVRRR